MADRSKQQRRGLDELTSEDKAILREAKDRFKVARNWESNFRKMYVDDVKFRWGDGENGWQWPSDIWQQRTAQINKRPALTINKVDRLVAQIVNNMRKNKASIAIKPANNMASFKSAEVYEGVVRHIEYTSAAQIIYDDAAESAVEGGIGYWRVLTKYADVDTFNQVITIDPVRDHMSVYLDPFIKRKDGLDSKWGFVFDELPMSEFEALYPDVPTVGVGLDDSDDWVSDDAVRIAEYYRIVYTDDELIFVEDERGQSSTFRRSDAPKSPEIAKMLRRAQDVEENGDDVKPGQGMKIKKRAIRIPNLEWYKIAASTIIERRKLKGSYVPVVRIVGRERVIEGKLERKGHVRNLKDPQRMYNYNSSGQVETGALGPKAKFITPASAIMGNETMWNDMNLSNRPYLTYRHADEEGNPIPKPELLQPTSAVPVYLDGMKIAAAEIEMAAGQQFPQQQNPAVERTPAGIQARERAAETSTYNYDDNQAIAIATTGKIIVDMLPHYYDAEQVIMILGKDGTESEVHIDPNLTNAVKEEQIGPDQIRVLFNPKVGKYNVEADVGPAYMTQRQEAFNAFVQITTADNQLIGDIGDLMFQSADFPLADKISERLKRKIRQERPWLLDDNAPTPAQQEAKKEIDALTQQVGELLHQLAQKELIIKGKDQRRDIEAYKAESDRAAKEANMVSDLLALESPRLKAALEKMIMEIFEQMNETNDISQEVNASQAAQRNGAGGV